MDNEQVNSKRKELGFEPLTSSDLTIEQARKELDIMHGQLSKGTPKEQIAKKVTFDKKLKEMIEIQKQIKAAK
jgi:hypothetical protein